METPTTPKRKYQKHKTDYKITVKHYLNTKITVFQPGWGNAHPIYLQITLKRQTTLIKSKFPLGLTIDKYKQWSANDSSFIRALEREKERVIYLIKLLKPFEHEDFDLSNISLAYNEDMRSLKYNIDTFLNFEIERVALECEPHLYDSYIDASPLATLEYYARKFPAVLELKKLYSSNIWFFEVYLDLIGKGVRNEFELYTQELLEKGPREAEGLETLSLLPPADIDVDLGYFQKEFVDFFHNSEESKAIIRDIESLFQTYTDYRKYRLSGL